jgi:membrane protein YqaA with SNARE-associated domain
MHALTRWIVGLYASPVGVVVLGVLDSTIFNWFPFGIDTAVVLLSARLGRLAWAAAVLATAGSVGGAALTFWMGAQLGEKGLERHVPPRRLERVRARVHRTGAIALAVLDRIPPPFPFAPFVLAAGALGVNAATFFGTLAVCRLIRFGAEALLAAAYGRRIIAWTQSDLFHDFVGLCIAAAVVASGLSVVRLTRGKPRRTRPTRPTRPT